MEIGIKEIGNEKHKINDKRRQERRNKKEIRGKEIGKKKHKLTTKPAGKGKRK